MTLEIQKFLRKPFPVTAVQITPMNMVEVAAWCKGTVELAEAKKGRPPAPYVHVPVVRPRFDFHTRAYIGNWVVKAGEGFKVYTEKSLRENFDAHPEYRNGFPQTDGVFVDDDVFTEDEVRKANEFMDPGYAERVAR